MHPQGQISALSGASGLRIRYPYAAACSALGIQLLRHTGCRNLSGSLKRNAFLFDSVIRFEQKKLLPVFLCRITRLILFWTPASLLSIWVKRIIWSVHLTSGSRHWIFYLKTKKDSFQKENMKLVTEEIYPAYQNLITAIKSLKGKGMNEQGLSHFPYGKKIL